MYSNGFFAMYHSTQMIGSEVCFPLFDHNCEVKFKEYEKPPHYPAHIARFIHQLQKYLMIYEEHTFVCELYFLTAKIIPKPLHSVVE